MEQTQKTPFNTHIKDVHSQPRMVFVEFWLNFAMKKIKDKPHIKSVVQTFTAAKRLIY